MTWLARLRDWLRPDHCVRCGDSWSITGEMRSLDPSHRAQACPTCGYARAKPAVLERNALS